MAADNYDACYDFTLGQEGGYQCDPNDKGNWTGCAVGAGELKGTNKGISACAYPELDIKNLSDEQIADIYERDYWNKVGGDDQPYGVDLCTWDSGVNSGPARGVEWLQRAIGMPAEQIDGAWGPITQSYVDAITDAHAVIESMCDQRLAFLRSLDTWALYGAGWSNRVAAVRETAHAMQDDMPVPEPAPPPKPAPAPEARATITITITLDVPAGTTATVEGP